MSSKKQRKSKQKARLENKLHNNNVKELIIPGSNIFCVGYLDRGTVRQDIWYSWRRSENEMAR